MLVKVIKLIENQNLLQKCPLFNPLKARTLLQNFAKILNSFSSFCVFFIVSPFCDSLSRTSSLPGGRGAVMAPPLFLSWYHHLLHLELSSEERMSNQPLKSPALSHLLICSNNSWTRNFPSKHQKCSKCKIIYSHAFTEDVLFSKSKLQL